MACSSSQSIVSVLMSKLLLFPLNQWFSMGHELSLQSVWGRGLGVSFGKLGVYACVYVYMYVYVYVYVFIWFDRIEYRTCGQEFLKPVFLRWCSCHWSRAKIVLLDWKMLSR